MERDLCLWLLALQSPNQSLQSWALRNLFSPFVEKSIFSRSDTSSEQIAVEQRQLNMKLICPSKSPDEVSYFRGAKGCERDRESKVSREPDIERFPDIYYDLFRQLAWMGRHPFLIPKKIVNLINIMLPILKEPREGELVRFAKVPETG